MDLLAVERIPSVYRKIREDLLSGCWENGTKLSELKLAAVDNDEVTNVTRVTRFELR